MFDAKRLLDQVMGAAQGGAQGQNGARTGSGGTGQLATGALAGGALGLLLGNKKMRKKMGKGAGTALKLGGLAAVAAVAYTAYQRHQAGTAQPAAPDALPPGDSDFAPDNAPQGADALARGVLVAMVQGAKADGHIDADEQARIFGQLDALGLDAEGKAFVMDELAAPQDMGRVTAHAATPEIAAELYAASLLAMDPDTDAERAYLDALAGQLGLDPAMTRELERAAAEAA